MSFFTQKRFFPLFVTQFLGALNDNMLKNAFVMLVTYQLATQTALLVTLAGGIFILPFFLFSATAGQLADKYDRSRLTHFIKLAEIGIMLVAIVGFAMQSVFLLLLALFGMGVHSTFFGPIKYAFLPQHLAPEELLAGNAAIEAGTFLAILLGTILGGILILQAGGFYFISASLLVVAIAGYISSRFLPVSPASQPDLVITRNIFTATVEILRDSRKDPAMFRIIIGISWFWFVGVTFLTQFAPLVKDVLHGEAVIVTLLLTLFSLSIGIGSFLGNVLLKGVINARFASWAAFGISLFGLDFYVATLYLPVAENAGLYSFLHHFAYLRLALDLCLVAISGGIYIVPLYAMMQQRAEAHHQARIIAANNVINALFMVASALFSLALFSIGLTIPQLFLVLVVANAGMAFYSLRFK